ncbi:lymphocyte-specific helicase-like [Liolophura sinensis]|uniref:lymphocyte-specific helicase-like n=1 Tax=Liolophura sinensis TaxID=3198878 RepID=UPI003158AD82
MTSEITDASGILTNEMIKEEKHLHEESVKEEEKIKEKQTELMREMTEDLREERYKRLQFLLSKSNMYTQYLIQRMERQKEEERKRRERILKKRAALQKKKEEAKRQEENTEKSSETMDNSARLASGSIVETRRGKREALSDSQESSQDSQSSSSKKRKRILSKADNTGDSDKQPSKKRKVTDNVSIEVDKENVTDNRVSLSESIEVASPGPKGDAESSLSQESDELLEEEEITVKKKRFIKGELAPPEQPHLFCGGVLRSYQVEGFKWLSMLYENGVNGILADEMGLGKTIQCIALLAHLASMGVGGPYLVVGPLSTLPNWYSEFVRFTPKVPVVLYHGSKDDRTSLRKKIRRLLPVKKNVLTQPVVITSYEIAMNDRKYLQNYEWKYLIVDEGHRIKNAQCRLIHELKMYKSTHRLLLTGTPLQNNLAELWSLLNFLLPEIFDDLGSFEAWFDVEYITGEGSDERLAADSQRQSVLSMLHQILTPFLLRRLKCDVDLCIPPKREVLVYAPLTCGQKEYYSALVNRTVLQMIEKKKVVEEKVEVSPNGRPVRRASRKVNYKLFIEDEMEDQEEKMKDEKADNSDEEDEELEEWVKAVMENQTNKLKKEEKRTLYSSQVTIKMANIMMQLRKCCNHPYLLEYPLDDQGEFKIDQQVISASGKMLLLDRMLPELQRRGHKVLLFSQMTKMLDIVEDYCYLKKIKYCRLDGSSKVEDRRDQIDTFNKEVDVFVFLLSTRAGGLGLNLVSADTVIIYDSDWNPQSDLQAQDRCHRIGQTKPVVVYRMVTANTIDQRIVERAAAKRKLEKMVIHKGKFKSGMNNFSTSLIPVNPEELLALLKTSDHEGVVQGKEGEVISDRDLQKLLDRSDLEQIWQKQKQLKLKEEDGKPVEETKEDACVKETRGDVSGIFKVLDTESGRVGLGATGENSALPTAGQS